VLECVGCGHVTCAAALSPCAEAEAEALQRAHFGDRFAGADDRWTQLVDRANARRVRRVLEAVLASRARVLEVGPGHGAMLIALAESGFDLAGLDLSSVVAEMTSCRSGVPVVVGTLEERVGAGIERYDAVVARHMLEHMVDPARAIEAMRRLLKPGGIAYVAVPNIGALESALPGWSGYQPYHLHYFTPVRLRALFERGGFVVTRLGTREPFSGWFNTVAGLLRGGSGNDSAAPRVRPSGVVVGIYNTARMLSGALLAPARLVQALSGYGEEIEMLARRPAGG
jgi:SAM-dependent methyltransferase